MLRKKFWPNRNEITGDWRRLHDDELHDLYSLDTVQVIKSRRMKWMGHVGERRDAYRVLVGKSE